MKNKNVLHLNEMLENAAKRQIDSKENLKKYFSPLILIEEFRQKQVRRFHVENHSVFFFGYEVLANEDFTETDCPLIAP